jgi:hypothetical protein
MGEFVSPTLGDCRSEILFEIAEKEEWRFGSKLFAHEEKWGGGREQEDRGRRAQGTTVCNVSDSLSERTVSDLVMILKKGDKGGERQALGSLTTWFTIPVRGNFALIRESIYQAMAQLIERAFRIV